MQEQLNDHVVEGDTSPQLAIEVRDLPGQGGACHRYDILGFDTTDNPSATPPDGFRASFTHLPIIFQNGQIKEFGVNGVSPCRSPSSETKRNGRVEQTQVNCGILALSADSLRRVCKGHVMNNETINIGGGAVPLSSTFTFNHLRYNLELIIHEKFNHLKARLMNLAETSTSDTRQCNAMKGLMKDFLNQAYFGTLDFVRGELKNRGLDDDCHTDGPRPGLDAKGLDSILVE